MRLLRRHGRARHRVPRLGPAGSAEPRLKNYRGVSGSLTMSKMLQWLILDQVGDFGVVQVLS